VSIARSFAAHPVICTSFAGRCRFAMAFVIALLTACGGGSSNDSGSPAPAAAAIEIASFTPEQAGPGATVTVLGTGFGAVQSARVGATSASFTIDSATQLRLIVPDGASTGPVELAGGGRVAQSAGALVVLSVPRITRVAPTSVVAPARIDVTGTDLDKVAQARLNATVLAIASQSPTALALDVPVGASSGFLTLVGTDGVARTSAQQITVVGSIAVEGFAPTTVARGLTLNVNGANLDRATAVEFAGGARAPVATRTGSTSIAVTVPAAANSGVFAVIGNAGERVDAPAILTVVPRIEVDGSAVYRVAAGAPVTINGTGLNEVSAVTVGASAATIGARSDTQLTFTVPAGVNCGPITLLSQSQPSVAAGSVVVGAGCNVRSAGVEFAQVYSQSAATTYQRLVPGKETWVRAYVVAETAGTAAPAVRLTGLNGTTALGTIAMTGPAVLPQLAAGAAVPDSMRYNEAQTFNASLPPSWVRAGLSVRVEIDPDRRYGNPVVVDATPAVGTATRIDLVLVPLVSGGNVPLMPSAAEVADEIVRRLPIARENVSVAIRQPYTLTSVTDGVDTSSEWSSALSELETLRRSEARTKHYYGFVRPMVSAGTAGIGYVNRVGSTSPNLSAIGWDASRASWRRTFSHELGHNFSRPHAPCGGADGPDPNYPYPNGALSGTPLFDSLLDDIVSPAGMSDIMGYCSGTWFSDYNYREVQRFVEAQPQPSLAIQSAERAAEIVVVSGSIGLDGVRFNPVQRMRGEAPIAQAGEYTLRLATAAGATIEVPFDAVRVDHAMPPELHFFVKLPDPGALAQVAVLRGATVLTEAGAGTVRAQGQRAPAPTSASVDWSQDAGALVLAWDAAAYRYLSVTHVADDGARRVLALLLTGGSARIDVGDLPRGGELEFALSDGLNTRILVAPR
jgi:hypothetical protein